MMPCACISIASWITSSSVRAPRLRFIVRFVSAERSQACLALASNVGGRERHRLVFALPRAGFFLKLTLCRSKKRWRALRLPGMPCLAMTARISSRVKFGCLAIRAKIQSECSSNGETLPPLRFGAALPVSLQRWHHRITELTPTLKISRLSPAATLRFRPLQPRAANDRDKRPAAPGTPPAASSTRSLARAEVEELLVQIKRGGLTIVLVEQNAIAALCIADRLHDTRQRAYRLPRRAGAGSLRQAVATRLPCRLAHS